jgi:hypothetical protein
LADLDSVKAQLREVLESNSEFEVLDEGFSWYEPDAFVVASFFDWSQWGDTHAVVSLKATFLRDVPPTPALYEYVAFHADDSSPLGHLTCTEADEGVMVSLLHNVIADEYDALDFTLLINELFSDVASIAEGFEAQFGGTLVGREA